MTTVATGDDPCYSMHPQTSCWCYCCILVQILDIVVVIMHRAELRCHQLADVVVPLPDHKYSSPNIDVPLHSLSLVGAAIPPPFASREKWSQKCPSHAIHLDHPFTYWVRCAGGGLGRLVQGQAESDKGVNIAVIFAKAVIWLLLGFVNANGITLTGTRRRDL